MAETAKQKECAVCGYTKHVDRCHIIPKFFLSKVVGYQDLAGFKGCNIVSLCKTHHWEYDRNIMSNRDFKKVLRYILLSELSTRYVRLICAHVAPKEGVKYTTETIRQMHAFNKWIKTTQLRLKKMGLGVPKSHVKR